MIAIPEYLVEEGPMITTKRIRRDPSEAKLLILDTAEAMMLEEGYAAVTVRGIAKQAGVSSTLLHYYYPTVDDLLVALYRRAYENDLGSLHRALNAEDPLSALWAYQNDAARTALGAEFMALANHRKIIRTEIARSAEHIRSLQAATIVRVFGGDGGESLPCSPLALSTLLTCVARNLKVESGVGITSGHEEARAFVEAQLAKLQTQARRIY